MAASKPLALNNSALHLLHRAGQVADDLFAREFDESEITPRQFAVLKALVDRETASQSDLVLVTGIDRSTIAEIIQRLMRRGLIGRRRDRQDARAYAVRLTSSGRTMIDATALRVHKVEAQLCKALASDRRKPFLSDLALLVTENSVDPNTRRRAP